MTYIPGVAKGVFAGLGGAFRVIVREWQQIISAFWTLFVDLAKNRFTLLSEIFSSLTIRFGEQFSNLWKLFKDLAVIYINTVARVYKSVWDVLAEFTGKAMDSALDMSLDKFVKKVMGILPAIAKAVASAISGTFGIAVQGAELAESVAKSGIGGAAAGEAVDFGSRILDAIEKGSQGEGAETDVLSDFKAIFKTELENIKRVSESLVKMAGDDLSALANFNAGLADLGDEARAAFLEEFKDIFSGVEGPVESAITAELKERLKKLMEKVAEAVPETAKAAVATAAKGVPIKGGAGGLGGGLGGASGTAAVATFSAAAALALGFGQQAEPGNKRWREQRKILEETRDIQKAIAAATKETNTELGRFINGMAFR
jgi:hypothetical protein